MMAMPLTVSLVVVSSRVVSCRVVLLDCCCGNVCSQINQPTNQQPNKRNTYVPTHSLGASSRVLLKNHYTDKSASRIGNLDVPVVVVVLFNVNSRTRVRAKTDNFSLSVSVCLPLSLSLSLSRTLDDGVMTENSVLRLVRFAIKSCIYTCQLRSAGFVSVPSHFTIRWLIAHLSNN